MNDFYLQITFFHPWKDYKTTRKYPLRNLEGGNLETQLSHADNLLTNVTKEIYYISGGQGILEGKIFHDKKARIVHSLHEQYPPPIENQGYAFLNYVLVMKFSYQMFVPRVDGTIFRNAGAKTINIPSLFNSPLFRVGTKLANINEPLFQQFINRFSETGNLGLVNNYDSWGNLIEARFKMLASVKKENKRGARKKSSPKEASSTSNQFIYLIHIHNDIYKIGKSKDPNKRLKILQTSSPYKLSLVHNFSADNVNIAEQELHRSLSEVRQEGEWFVLSEEQKELICRIEEFKDRKFWTDKGKILDEKFSVLDGENNS